MAGTPAPVGRFGESGRTRGACRGAHQSCVEDVVGGRAMRTVFRRFVWAGVILASLAGAPVSAQDAGSIMAWGNNTYG